MGLDGSGRNGMQMGWDGTQMGRLGQDGMGRDADGMGRDEDAMGSRNFFKFKFFKHLNITIENLLDQIILSM